MKVFRFMAMGLDWKECKRLTEKLRAINEWVKEEKDVSFCVRKVRAYTHLEGEHVQCQPMDLR